MAKSINLNDSSNQNMKRISEANSFHEATMQWLLKAINLDYAQNFEWMGRPLIQVPQDIYAIQEIIWETKPDLIIECGIARGGSLIMSASILALLDYSDAVVNGDVLDPKASRRKVVGVDIDIRQHNRVAIEAHPMAHKIEMIEGSSIDKDIISKVQNIAQDYDDIMVFLDSNHTHDHVLEELRAYAPLVSRGNYCVVWDTGVEDLPDGFVTDRPWGKGNNPKTAVHAYLKELDEYKIMAKDGTKLSYEIDKVIEHKISITASPDGFLRRS